MGNSSLVVDLDVVCHEVVSSVRASLDKSIAASIIEALKKHAALSADASIAGLRDQIKCTFTLRPLALMGFTDSDF